MSKFRVYASLMLILAICLAINISPAIAQQGSNADESAIKATSAAFAAAFNKGDSKAIGALWTEDGIYVSDGGQQFDGRAAIEKEYQAFFDQLPGAQIQVQIKMVRILSPTSAAAAGASSLVEGDSPSPVSSKFMAIYQKKNGKWLINMARDERVEIASTLENMPDLSKLAGTWTCQEGASTVKTTCSMIAGGKFVERVYSVSENGNVTHSGKQIIGWNPIEQQITSWLFDSAGGHDYGVWQPQGKSAWVSRCTGATADGTPTTATNMFNFVDDNTITWKSVDRTMGGQPLPDSGVLTLKRVSK